MYLKYFLESGIFAQDSKDSESRTLFYFVTDPSAYVGPYAYGTSHTRILIWDAHTRMGQHLVPYKYYS